MRWGAITLISVVCAACGGGATPPPDQLSAADLVVETDPLTLRLTTPRGDFVVPSFVEVGTVNFFDEGRYYDPRDLPADAINWQAATRATGYDADADAVVLDNGARLQVTAGPIDGVATLVVDASAVDKAVMLRVVLPYDPGEPVFGFGESFAAADASGGVREMQFRVDTESESSLNEAHVPVPLSLWPSRGAGAFVEDLRPGAFDVAAARDDAVLATYTLPARGALHVHLFTADDPLELLRVYARLTATPALPPRWAFAPQQWRNEHESSQEVRDDADRMRAEAIPGSVMWIDNPWQTAYNDFTFDETRFDGAQALIDELTAKGYKVLVWSTPYVNNTGPTADDFSEARANGYLVTDDVGRPFIFPWQDGPGALMDFTADGAKAWWRERIARVTDMGIDGFKLDFGEDVVPELGNRIAPLHLAAGDASIMHDAYTEHYHDTYLGALPEGDGFLITRAGYWGEQKTNTCIWPGDLDNDFSLHGVDNGLGKINVGGLPAAVAAMLSLSASGYPFFGSDIGGFRNGVPTTEVLIRWTQYAALGTVMQLGGGGASHNPWDDTLFDPPALDVYRTYARLHMDLVPYLYSLAREAAADGTPVTRPTRLVHYDAASDDATFFLGDAIFVAPVITAGATTRAVVLPPGEWVDWWTGARATGDGQTSIDAAAPLETLPLWRRLDAMVPMYARAADTLVEATAAGVTSYADPAFGRELRLLWSASGAATERTLFDGASAAASTDGGAYQIVATAGQEFDVMTFDIDLADLPGGAGVSMVSRDGVTLPSVVDLAEVETCALPGCYWHDLAGARVVVRAELATTHTVRVHP